MSTETDIEPRRRQLAFTLAMLALVVAGVVTWIRLADQPTVPLLAEEGISIASIITEITLAVGLLITAISFRYCVVIAPTPGDVWIFDTGIHWITRLSISAAVGVVWTGLSAAAFAFAVVLLPNFSPIPSLVMVVIAAGYAGVLGYVASYTASHTNMMRAIRLAGLVALFGVGLAILFASNLDWWTNAISFLGVDANGRIFNITFIMLGLILLSIFQDMMRDVINLLQTGLFVAPYFRWLHLAFVAMCLAVAGIGLFPFAGATRVFHQLVAHLAVALMIILMLVTPRVMPIYQPRFQWISWVMVAICVGVVAAHYVANFNFTLMELILLAVPGLWLAIFYSETREFIRQKNPSLITATRVLG